MWRIFIASVIPFGFRVLVISVAYVYLNNKRSPPFLTLEMTSVAVRSRMIIMPES
jgi:hypothetical protein